MWIRLALSWASVEDFVVGGGERWNAELGGEGRVAGLPCWGPFLLKVSLPPSQRDLDPARSACPNFRSLSGGGVEVGVPFTYPPSRHSLQVALLRNCSRFCALGQTCRDPLRHWSPGPEVTLMTPRSMVSPGAGPPTPS